MPVTRDPEATPELSRSVIAIDITLGGILGIFTAALLNVGTFFLATRVLQIPLQVPMGPGGALAELSWISVLVSTCVPGVLAMPVGVLLHKTFRRGMLIFAGLALAILALSLIPVAMMAVPWSAKLVLGLMHVVAAGSSSAGIIVMALTSADRPFR